MSEILYITSTSNNVEPELTCLMLSMHAAGGYPCATSPGLSATALSATVGAAGMCLATDCYYEVQHLHAR